LSQTNQKGTKYKTERFTLHEEKPGRWKVSGRDSNGSYRRIRFNAKDLSEAMKMAEETLLQPQAEKPETPNEPDEFPTLHISEALLRASATRNWTEYTRQKDDKFCEYFLEWIDKEGLAYWHELRYEHIQRYQRNLLDRGLAFDTIRLYLLPVRRTAAWAASNWPERYVNFCQSHRISRRDGRSSTYNEDEGNPYLSIHKVLDFLDWLARKEGQDSLIIGVALQGLAGLQMQEALRLTWEKVDLNEGTITIDGVVKNRYRIRKIPIAKVIMWLLRRMRSASNPQGAVIPDYAAFDNYSHAAHREMRKWDAGVAIKPKDLRNTIQTEAIDGGWYGYYVQRYVGHAPATIGERHYHGDQGKRLISFFREKVVSHIDGEVDKWKAPADSPIIPGPRLAVNQ